jgi:hypothetical protein
MRNEVHKKILYFMFWRSNIYDIGAVVVQRQHKKMDHLGTDTRRDFCGHAACVRPSEIQPQPTWIF